MLLPPSFLVPHPNLTSCQISLTILHQTSTQPSSFTSFTTPLLHHLTLESLLVATFDVVIDKVLNLMRQECSDLFMEQDAPPSHPVPTLRIKDIPRYPNRDFGTMMGWSNLDTWDGTSSQCLVGFPPGLESFIVGLRHFREAHNHLYLNLHHSSFLVTHILCHLADHHVTTHPYPILILAQIPHSNTFL